MSKPGISILRMPASDLEVVAGISPKALEICKATEEVNISTLPRPVVRQEINEYLPYNSEFDPNSFIKTNSLSSDGNETVEISNSLKSLLEKDVLDTLLESNDSCTNFSSPETCGEPPVVLPPICPPTTFVPTFIPASPFSPTPTTVLPGIRYATELPGESRHTSILPASMVPPVTGPVKPTKTTLPPKNDCGESLLPPVPPAVSPPKDLPEGEPNLVPAEFPGNGGGGGGGNEDPEEPEGLYYAVINTVSDQVCANGVDTCILAISVFLDAEHNSPAPEGITVTPTHNGVDITFTPPTRVTNAFGNCEDILVSSNTVQANIDFCVTGPEIIDCEPLDDQQEVDFIEC